MDTLSFTLLCLLIVAVGFHLAIWYELDRKKPIESFGVDRIKDAGRHDPEWTKRILDRGWITSREYMDQEKNTLKKIETEIKRRQKKGEM